MSEQSPTITTTEAFPAVSDRLQFSLRELLLWITAASAALAAIYWLGTFAAALVVLGIIGYLPYRVGLCGLSESSLMAAGLGLIAAMFMPTCVIPPDVARGSVCSNNLKTIMIALHNYHDTHGTFPPAYIANANGKPLHSWRVLILPFMEQESLYQQYRFDEPWDGPNNSKLHSQAAKIFSCPSSPSFADGTTSYVAVVGPRTVWPGENGLSTRSVQDDANSTLLVVEVHNSGIHWMEPRDLHMTQMATTINPNRGQGISSKHANRANVISVSGMVGRLPSDLAAEDLEALLTIDGGEKIQLP